MTTDAATEPQNTPIRTEDVPWTEFAHGDRFALRYRHLASATVRQPYRIGVSREELPPGKQACPAHYHTQEEEHVLILSGALTVRIGDRRHIMQAGDYVRFAAGAAEAHCLYNHTDAPCTFLMIGDDHPDDVCVYPDSNKIKVKATGEIYDKGATRDYWDREG